MKKSKLLAPAFAFLALSTAAAVTGTVAWFTANRIVEIGQSAITAINPEENLEVTLKQATGATLTTPSGTGMTAETKAVATIGNLRDASVDVPNQTVYRANLNDAGSAPASFSVVDNLLYGTYDSANVYYAAQYTAEFELNAGKSSQVFDLSFDNTRTVATNSQNLALAEGLRIGMFFSSSKYCVLAPFKTGTSLTDEDLTYVHGTEPSASNPSAYAAANSFYAGQVGSYTFTTISGSTHQSVVIYTWFEGSDTTVVNGNVNSSRTISVDLFFKISEHVGA